MEKITMSDIDDIKGLKLSLDDMEEFDPQMFTLPSEMPGVVPSEEYTGTMGVDTPAPSKGGTIRGFNDPLTQGVA